MTRAFLEMASKESRIVAGLMSGTSLDGVDCVIAKLTGSGRNLRFQILGKAFLPYSPTLINLLLQNSSANSSSVVALSQLNTRLPIHYADAVHAALEEAGLYPADLDLVGSHGQTVHHVPVPETCDGALVRSTLQIGDISTLSIRLGVPVVGDFRMADMALGGQGAPLVPYLDYALFTHVTENRGLLNIGGIANLTILKNNTSLDQVIAFDTGPGNMIMDFLAGHFFGQPYDEDGTHALGGQVHEELLKALLSDTYFDISPPKSTGRERFGAHFIQTYLNEYPGLTAQDWLATVSELTAVSVHRAYRQFVQPHALLDRLLVSGGGRHNRYLMSRLDQCFSSVRVQPLDEHGIDSDIKEALCFAVLAHEYMNGVPTGLPSVTGATKPAMQGKMALPPIATN